MRKKILILTGATASGKSALALDIARGFSAVIINADSKQVYRDIPIITAQPSVEEQREIPHRLYGCVDADISYSAGMWVDEVCCEIEAVWASGKLPMLVGGSGLYVQGLMKGFSPIPDVSEEVFSSVEKFYLEQGLQGLEREVARVDPSLFSKLLPNDTQRLKRAYAVWKETGVALSEWQKREPVAPFMDVEFGVYVLAPERAQLYRNAEVRFDAMMEAGAIEEISALNKRNLSPHLSAMKAHGVPEIIAYLAGKMPLQEARERAILNVRHYIKRQHTWFRNQLERAVWGNSAEELRARIIGGLSGH